MKIKQYLYISNPVEFLNRGNGLHFSQYDGAIDGWISLGEVEFEVDIVVEEVTKQALAGIDEAEAKIRKELESKLAALESERKNLLAIGWEK